MTQPSCRDFRENFCLESPLDLRLTPRTFGSKGTDNLIQANRIRRTIGSDEPRERGL